LGWVVRVPLALTALRGLLAPVVVVLAVQQAGGLAFGACLVVAFLSDVFDGVIARRLKVATPLLRRLDSVADSAFYVAAVFAAWYLHRGRITEHFTGLEVLIGLEIVRYGVDWQRFGREAAYHMWSSKLWGISLFVGFFSVLVFGAGGWPVSLAIYAGILADMEGLAISFILLECKNDVPTFVHALRIRNSAA